MAIASITPSKTMRMVPCDWVMARTYHPAVAGCHLAIPWTTPRTGYILVGMRRCVASMFVVALVAGCGPGASTSRVKAPAEKVVVAPPTPSPGPSASVVPAAPTEVTAAIEQRLDPATPSELRLWLTIAVMGVERPLKSVPSRFACVVGRAERGRESSMASSITTIVCDPQGPRVHVLRAVARGIEVDSTLVEVPAHVSIATGRVKRPPRNCEGVAPTRVDVAIGQSILKTPPGEAAFPQLEVIARAPLLSLSAVLMTGPTRVQLDSAIEPGEVAMTVAMSSVETRMSADLRVEGDALLFSEGSHGYDGTSHEDKGGWMLPCKASVRFQPVHYEAKGWSPMGDDCPDCRLAERACDARCSTMPDEADQTPSAAKVQCITTCSGIRIACDERCKAKLAAEAAGKNK
jgi:hypothetical protein